MIQHEIEAVTHTALNRICFTYVFNAATVLKVDIPKI